MEQRNKYLKLASNNENNTQLYTARLKTLAPNTKGTNSAAFINHLFPKETRSILVNS